MLTFLDSKRKTVHSELNITRTPDTTEALLTFRNLPLVSRLLEGRP